MAMFKYLQRFKLSKFSSHASDGMNEVTEVCFTAPVAYTKGNQLFYMVAL